MGRKKIRIEPLPESQIRAKFKKRKDGLKNKAYELGTLCGAQVALLAFSKDGEDVIDESFNGSTVEIFEKYLRYLERGSAGQQRPSSAQQLPPAPHAGGPHVPLYQGNGMRQQQEMGINMASTSTSIMRYEPSLDMPPSTSTSNMRYEPGLDMPPSTGASDMRYEPGLDMPYVDANGSGHYGVFEGQDMSNYMPHAGQRGPHQFVPVAPSNVPFGCTCYPSGSGPL